MLQTLIYILVSLISDNAIGVAVWEWQSLDSTHHYYGENYQFEDGSYIHSNEWGTVAGCTPFELCSWVGIDTPWEDILDTEEAAYMYQIVNMYKYAPAKFKLLGNQYH